MAEKQDPLDARYLSMNKSVGVPRSVMKALSSFTARGHVVKNESLQTNPLRSSASSDKLDS